MGYHFSFLLVSQRPKRPVPIRSTVAGSGAGLGGWGGFSGEEVFRGVGIPVIKSAALLSVSWRPPPRRNIAVEFVVAGAGEAS